MPEGQMSFVKAVMHYFGEGEHGRKVGIPEFQALTHKDKEELREGLAEIGYDVGPVQAASS